MKGKGLLIAIGSGKPMAGMGKPATDDKEAESESPVEDDALALAFDALKAGKSDAFVKAMKSAIKACTDSYGEEG